MSSCSYLEYKLFWTRLCRCFQCMAGSMHSGLLQQIMVIKASDKNIDYFFSVSILLLISTNVYKLLLKP